MFRPHPITSSKWFNDLNHVHGKEYITFEDNNNSKVVAHGAVKVNGTFVLKDIALVENLHFNLLSILQLFEDGFEVCFKKGLLRVLDPQGNLICQIFPFGQVFCANFLKSVGPS